ncbi:MAG: type II CRISPR-associated endonuclease Cas1 [Candidatus Sumerlaeia bacterium]|nr:type II CRISPR-associated endonuclease Cas1 [Candidatus Sumerlaeia bacterium]
MTRRTIEVSGHDVHLSLAHHQVKITRGGEAVGSVPAEEVALLIVDTPTASYTHPTVVELLAQGAAVVFCGPDHLPAGIALPIEGHHLQAERFRAQMEASLPTRKRLWQQIVAAKIAAQASACTDDAVRRRLEVLRTRVRSGDPANVEAQAARFYWGAWMPEIGFRRDRDGPFPNGLLNYGYMMMRAALARALVAAGFHPSFGLRHTNRYNAFALADDFVEPFRPLVDCQVRQLARNASGAIGRAEKQALLSLLTHPTDSAAGTGPLINALEPLCISLHRCLLGEERTLAIPVPRLDLIDTPPEPPS